MNISVLITTKNEEKNIGRCIKSLLSFNDIIVVDLNSDDKTVEVASSLGARIEQFTWDAQYPKKRQWCLDNLSSLHDWVLFIDADETMPKQLIKEIKSLNFLAAGYFIKGQYLWDGKPLKHGIQNNKLVLFNRHKIKFPMIDDLKEEMCMGEMEGHYQPVLKEKYAYEKIEQLKNPVLHDAYIDQNKWQNRHERYARWEAAMITNNSYPKDPIRVREVIKKIFRNLPCRGSLAFIYSFIFKLGFLDGKNGYAFALSRYNYYKMVTAFSSANKQKVKNSAIDKPSSVM